MYRSESEFCMDLWRDLCGLEPIQKRHIPDLDELRQTEWCSEFEQMMRNRLIMGATRYETFAEKRHKKYCYAEEAIKKLANYLITNNTELLIDAGNYCLLEFKFGQRDNKYFKAQDDSEHAYCLGTMKK